MPEALLPFYVYVLADKKDIRSIFYVGMGSNERVLTHWKEVQYMLNNQLEPAHPKHHRMLEIARNGSEPIQVVIGRFETRDEAYAVEATLINWVYGYENLTNLSRGHNADQVRPFDFWDLISGIDVERSQSDGGEMTLVMPDDQRNNWLTQRGQPGKVGVEIFDHINGYACRRYGKKLAEQKLQIAYRTTSTRITFFLDDQTNPARPERRKLPNPLCRIRMDGSTNGARLHLEFTKNDETTALSIFENAREVLDMRGVELIQPEKQSRYDLLIQLPTQVDASSLKEILDIALAAAIDATITLPEEK